MIWCDIEHFSVLFLERAYVAAGYPLCNPL